MLTDRYLLLTTKLSKECNIWRSGITCTLKCCTHLCSFRHYVWFLDKENDKSCNWQCCIAQAIVAMIKGITMWLWSCFFTMSARDPVSNFWRYSPCVMSSHAIKADISFRPLLGGELISAIRCNAAVYESNHTRSCWLSHTLVYNNTERFEVKTMEHALYSIDVVIHGDVLVGPKHKLVQIYALYHQCCLHVTEINIHISCSVECHS